jgi:hypothetical protein
MAWAKHIARMEERRFLVTCITPICHHEGESDPQGMRGKIPVTPEIPTWYKCANKPDTCS